MRGNRLLPALLLIGPSLAEGLTVGLLPGPACAQEAPRGGPSPAPAGAGVYFVDVRDGAVIPPKSVIHFGLHGMGIAPAGVPREHAGHHHLLIDADLPPLDQPIPNDFNHLHFGAGQTEARVTLPPGRHTLQLLLADEEHVPHDPPVFSQPVRILVTLTGRPPRARVAQRRRVPPQRARLVQERPPMGPPRRWR